MGVLDFAKDAGAKIGIGESSAEKKAKAARAKAQADMAKAKRERLAKQKVAAAARKREQAAKEKQEKAVAAEAKYEKEKGDKLEAYLSKLGLKAQGMSVAFNDGTATVRGTAANPAAKEKIALALGNVEGVKKVNDMLKVKPAPKRAATTKQLTPAQRKAATARRRAKAKAASTYTVKSGDSLSKIAQKHLGDANRYMEIFTANQPMLSDPNMIHPGQVLRIPRK